MHRARDPFVAACARLLFITTELKRFTSLAERGHPDANSSVVASACTRIDEWMASRRVALTFHSFARVLADKRKKQIEAT